MTSKSSAELKKEARRRLKGKYGIAIIAIAVISMFVMLLSFTLQIFMIIAMTVGTAFGTLSKSAFLLLGSVFITMLVMLAAYLLIMIVENMFILGYLKFCLNLCTGQPVEVRDVFYAFTHNPMKFVKLNLAVSLASVIIALPVLLICLLTTILPTVLACLTAIIGYPAVYVGVIILMMNLSMAFYVMVDDPDIGVIQCLKESCRIMNGNKGRLFYIGLSFIGMAFLALLSLGIGYMWVLPYMCVTITFFYLDIRSPGNKELVSDPPEMDDVLKGAAYIMNP